MDAETDATRAQNDARFAEVLSKLDALAMRVNHIPDWRLMLAIFGGAFAGPIIVGVVIIMAVFQP